MTQKWRLLWWGGIVLMPVCFWLWFGLVFGVEGATAWGAQHGAPPYQMHIFYWAVWPFGLYGTLIYLVCAFEGSWGQLIVYLMMMVFFYGITVLGGVAHHPLTSEVRMDS